ncbi:hypothetical protein SK128_004994 [Halocaridina rubra]|uniref:Ionotropic glutamate receptor L-glutamate and glycine-binding domain-containing protein n=1 Tax=Halocaridina rubra TaxID=373956 RepID=A0AAN8X348_HALRR
MKNPMVKGTMMEVLSILSQKLGFCYRFEIPRDRGSGGTQLKNGSWTGIMGAILRGEADMSALGISITPERAEFADVSEYLYLDEMSAMYVRPSLESDIIGFIKPYTLTVWMSVLLSVCAIITAMYIISMTNNCFIISRREATPSGNSVSTESRKPFTVMYNISTWIFAALLGQRMYNFRAGLIMKQYLQEIRDSINGFIIVLHLNNKLTKRSDPLQF